MKPSYYYFDDNIFEKEQDRLFHNARYLGHELAVNNYLTLEQDNHARTLIRTDRGVECISNVCRHRQAIMLKGSGTTKNVVCPLHGWTYDLNGQLVGAPYFDPCPERHLRKSLTQSWNGLMFDNGYIDLQKELADMRLAKYFDFTGYAFHSRKIHQCNYNWKTFIEVYLDDYHVKPFHPGLGSFVDCDNLDWQFGNSYSVQSVGIYNDLRTSGSTVYSRWHKMLLDYTGGKIPDFGAIWLTLYPNVMLEWYPHVLVVSTLWPEGPQSTKNIVEFYYPEEIVHFEPEFIEAHQAAYMETCDEDDEIAERMDQGRYYNYKKNMDDYGPVHEPMEKGLPFFYKYYDNHIPVNPFWEVKD